jgi:hypothetical protein
MTAARSAATAHGVMDLTARDAVITGRSRTDDALPGARVLRGSCEGSLSVFVHVPKSRGVRSALLAAAACLAMGAGATAQTVPGRTVIDTSGTPGAGKRRSELTAKPSRTDQPLSLGDWLFYPYVDVGYVYNDNVYASQFNKVASSGLRITPSFVARRNAGIHDTTLYATGDAQIYDQSNANQFTGRAGVTHTWEIRRDLVARFQAEFGRFSSLSSSSFTPQLKPVYYNQGFLSGSVTKSFNDFFVSGGASLTDVNYSSSRYPDGTTYQILGRLGYNISPVLYSYIEPSYNAAQSSSGPNSNGYAIVGGLGSNRIGLYTFRVFAGYNAQQYSGGAGSFSGPTFGGSASWEALRTLTFTANVNHSLGLAGGQVVGPNFSSIVNRTSFSLGANYAMTRQLNASLTGSYDYEAYSGVNRTDRITAVNASLSYMVTRYLGLSTNYTFSKVNSTYPGASFSQNVFSIGGRAQF